MSVFRQILFTAVVAGLIGGALLTLLQNIGHVGVVPLILEAETYENGRRGDGGDSRCRDGGNRGCAFPRA